MGLDGCPGFCQTQEPCRKGVFVGVQPCIWTKLLSSLWVSAAAAQEWLPALPWGHNAFRWPWGQWEGERDSVPHQGSCGPGASAWSTLGPCRTCPMKIRPLHQQPPSDCRREGTIPKCEMRWLCPAPVSYSFTDFGGPACVPGTVLWIAAEN